MTKEMLKALVNIVIDSDTEDKDKILAELDKEINRGSEAKTAKAQAYETAWNAVREVLAVANSGVTVAEIFDSLRDCDLTKGQISYGLTHQWADRVVKTTGKVNTYTLKV